MNSLRIGLLANLTKAGAVTLFAATAACSSSSSTAPPGNTATPGADGGATGAVVDGPSSAMLCPTLTKATYATKISLAVTWPGTQAVVVGKTGTVLIYLLSVYNIDGNNKVTGTTTTCGNTTPPITLSMTADTLTGLPQGSQVQNAFPASSWAGVPATNITGTLGGLHVGASITIDPVVTLYGVSNTSDLIKATTKWPANGTDIDPTQLTTADGGAFTAGGSALAGVTAIPVGTSPFVLPKTSLDMTAPAADQLQIVLRTALSLYGTSSSCDEQTGTATVTQLNNHVVGCSLADDGGTCTPDEYNFIDGNTTQYVPGAGTFDAKKLADTATCADVLSAYP
jgi:hypothetical protein